MVIQDQVKRFWWRMMAIGTVIDVAIAYGLAWWFGSSDNWLLTTGIIWLILQAVTVAMALRYVLHATLTWKLGQGQIVEDAFLAELRRMKLPAPNHFEPSVESYLNDIVENEEQPNEKRIGAASLAGLRTSLNETLGFVRGMLFRGAHERALKRYSEQHIG